MSQPTVGLNDQGKLLKLEASNSYKNLKLPRYFNIILTNDNILMDDNNK